MVATARQDCETADYSLSSAVNHPLSSLGDSFRRKIINRKHLRECIQRVAVFKQEAICVRAYLENCNPISNAFMSSIKYPRHISLSFNLSSILGIYSSLCVNFRNIRLSSWTMANQIFDATRCRSILPEVATLWIIRFFQNQRFRRGWHFASLKKQHVKRDTWTLFKQTKRSASTRARKRCSFSSRGAWKQWPGGYKTKYVHAYIYIY